MGYTELAKHEKYDFNIDKEAKSLVAGVHGYYTEADRLSFERNYIDITKSINPKEYELIVDCRRMETSDDSLLEALGAVFKVYQATGFHTIKVVKSTSAITHRQLKTAIKNVGVPVVYLDTL